MQQTSLFESQKNTITRPNGQRRLPEIKRPSAARASTMAARSAPDDERQSLRQPQLEIDSWIDEFREVSESSLAEAVVEVLEMYRDGFSGEMAARWLVLSGN